MSLDFQTSIILCMTKNHVIGESGASKLLWKQRDDMTFFKKMTDNQIVVMGYNTYLSLDKKPLKNRINVVLTSKDLPDTDDFLFIKTLNDVKYIAYFYHKDVFIIGGLQLYDAAIQALPIDDVYITILDTEIEGDTLLHFNHEFDMIRSLHKGHSNEHNQYDYEIIQARLT